MQVGAALCLTKIIQNAPVQLFKSQIPQSTPSFLSQLSSYLFNALSSSSCKAHTQLLESLISLILAVELDFGSEAPQFLPVLLDCLTMAEWTTRKMAIDVIYTMGAILRDHKENVMG